jgi:hypothetical protein
MTVRVNTDFANAVFNNIGGLGEYPNPRPELVDWQRGTPDNDHFHAMLRKYVVPYVLAMEDFWLEKAKLALRYALTFERDQAASHYGGFHTTLFEPDPVELMYVWLWEDAFPNEPWELPADGMFDLVVDFDETNSIMLKWGSKIPNPLMDSEFLKLSTVAPRFEQYDHRPDIRAAMEASWAKRPGS